MNLAKAASAAVLLALAPLALAQQPAAGSSIGTESRAPAPSQSDSPFPIFSAAALGSQKLEAEGCVIRPVMSDAQLKLCGATPPVYPPKKLVTDMIK